MRGIRLAALATAVLLLVSLPAVARELAVGQQASIDLPSGFTPGAGDGRTRFSYFGPAETVEVAILLYDHARFASAAAMASELLRTLGSQGETSAFAYAGRDAVLAELSFSLGGERRKGYGVFIHGESGCALLAHAPESRFAASADLIVSSLDAFAIDRAARRLPGPVSQFTLAWPPARTARKTATLPDGGRDLPWSDEERDEEGSVAEREHRVLSAYAETETLWVDAWARFYRMVYRQSAARLDRFVDAFAESLPLGDPTETARRVLSWVQGFTYERDVAGLDFVPPLAAAFERRGDCDARAVVMAIILERLGIDCVLMLSREYGHAMLAVDVPGGGKRFPYQGKDYLVAETTAKVGLGMIDAGQADFTKWLGVDLGE